MTEETLKVADDLVVSLDYTLRLDNDEIVDTSADREPLQFLQGQGQIIPGLEQALYGMALGEEKNVEVAPAEGYGVHNPDATQVVAHDMFPEDVDLEPGMGFRMQDQQGRSLLAFVDEIREDEVVLDFNHPLAGETLHFHVQVAGLRKATEQELAAVCGTGCAGCASAGVCS
ncbi:MAG TPA: peptidylprolyl isomerase [Chloroflexi bacterium]|nr:peptidylprolyl isomerase [Chloroflexota bacterium]